MGKGLNTIGGSTSPDIQAQVESSLVFLDGLISKDTESVELHRHQVRLWKARIARAEEVLTRVKPEGKESTEALLGQAQEYLISHEQKLIKAQDSLSKLNEHRLELAKTFEDLQATQRKIELQKRLIGIGIAENPETRDGETELPHLRELKQTIQTAKALVELRNEV